MPSTRRQKTKATRSREMDLLSDSDKVDLVLGAEGSNPNERLAHFINDLIGHNDAEVFLNNRGNSSQGNEIRDFNIERKISGHVDLWSQWYLFK